MTATKPPRKPVKKKPAKAQTTTPRKPTRDVLILLAPNAAALLRDLLTTLHTATLQTTQAETDLINSIIREIDDSH